MHGNALRDAYPVVLQTDNLGRVVGQQTDRTQAQIGEYGGRPAVLAPVRGLIECEIGCDSVESGVLQSVGRQLLQKADASTLVAPDVDKHAALAVDLLQGKIQLGSALTALRTERLTRQAFRMHPHQPVVAQLTCDQCNDLGAGLMVAVSNGPECTEAGGHQCIVTTDDPGSRRRHQPIRMSFAVTDQFRHREDRQIVTSSEVLDPG